MEMRETDSVKEPCFYSPKFHSHALFEIFGSIFIFRHSFFGYSGSTQPLALWAGGLNGNRRNSIVYISELLTELPNGIDSM